MSQRSRETASTWFAQERNALKNHQFDRAVGLAVLGLITAPARVFPKARRALNNWTETTTAPEAATKYAAEIAIAAVGALVLANINVPTAYAPGIHGPFGPSH